jgi:hypothetical protein
MDLHEMIHLILTIPRASQQICWLAIQGSRDYLLSMNLACLLSACIFFILTVSLSATENLRVPAFTAYLDPDQGGARVSKDRGIFRWNDPATKVTWFGEFRETGKLEVSLALQLPKGSSSTLKLTVFGRAMEKTILGSEDDVQSVRFGEVTLREPGYQSFVLESLNSKGQFTGNIEALVLSGPPIQNAHFNMKPRRNSASVHLAYPIKKGTKVSAFYVEMTGLEDPIWSYYMACGWHRGYFGMQVNSPTERRIIFSVWDSGNEAIDRDKVGNADRVTLVDKGKDVYSGDFGNEGTGGHSHLKFPWKTGENQRFLVTAEPVDATHTVFAGHYFRSDLKKWMLISSWKAPKEGKRLRGLYSFSENFVGKNGHVLRKALYGNQWIRTASGHWHELTRATFSHDSAGKADRLDRFMGLENEQFFLSHGGFVSGYTKFGQPFDRPAVVKSRSPMQMALPELPPVMK